MTNDNILRKTRCISRNFSFLFFQTTRLQILFKKREDYAEEVEQFQDLVKQMDDHKATLVKKVDERQEELSAITEKIDRASRKMEKLQKVIDTQELSVDDAKKLELEQQSMHESLERVLDQKQKLKESLLANEQELSKMFEVVDASIADWNEKILHLSVVPVVGQMYGPLKCVLNKDDQDPILETLREAQALIDKHLLEVEKRIDSSNKQLQDGLDELSTMDSEQEELSVKKKILESEYAKAEQTVAREQESHISKISVRQNEVTEMEERITRASGGNLEEVISAIDRSCADLETRIREVNEKVLERKKLLQGSIASACAMMKNHEAFVAQTVSQASSYARDKKASLSKITSGK